MNELSQKYYKLKTLAPFRKYATGIYWHGSTVVKIDFNIPEDVERFTATKFLFVIGDVEV